MPNEFAPPWLPRSRRRHVNHALSKLFHRNSCSICGKPFESGSPTAPGFDANGTVVLAGACCVSQVAQIFGMGLHQGTTAGHDEVIADIARRGGDLPITPQLNLDDSPWKQDDADWFERNPKRSHRVRMPFPGEYDTEARDAPPGDALIVLVRQLKPGCRVRPGVYLNSDLLPVPDDEAVIHGLFEAAMRREPMPFDREGLARLSRKYAMEPKQ
jgi:hypothetical protein